MTRRTSLHAVKDGDHFTQSSGLVAIHPIAEALKDEYFYFAWLLGRGAFPGLDYDPGAALSEKTGGYSFRE